MDIEKAAGDAQVLNPKMIAERLNISYGKALLLIKSGDLPSIKIGNHFKVSKESFQAWLSEPGLRKFL